mmetsp:Transcript_14815/g.62511  ORF Transcript_14815/g.62511 Transcript_14815/m.62511 type:complete len:193 (+) Transcript_14815:1051-1629(+)
MPRRQQECALLLTTETCERDRVRERDRAVKPHNVTTHYQLLAGADAGAAAVASAAACAAAFARAALSISSRAIFLASMSSTLVGEGAAVAARDKSRGPSPAAASKARRDARWVAHREHAHDGVHCASPQDAQTTREGPEPGRLVAAMRVRPRVAELRDAATGEQMNVLRETDMVSREVDEVHAASTRALRGT